MESDMTPAEQKFFDERVKNYRSEGDSGVEAERRAWMDVLERRHTGDDAANYQGIPSPRIVIPMKTPAPATKALTRYKFRAECMVDVLRFFDLISATEGIGALVNVYVSPLHEAEALPDVVASFGTSLTKERLLQLVKRVTDSHVIEGTIAEESEYTGDRRDMPRA